MQKFQKSRCYWKFLLRSLKEEKVQGPFPGAVLKFSQCFSSLAACGNYLETFKNTQWGIPTLMVQIYLCQSWGSLSSVAVASSHLCCTYAGHLEASHELQSTLQGRGSHKVPVHTEGKAITQVHDHKAERITRTIFQSCLLWHLCLSQCIFEKRLTFSQLNNSDNIYFINKYIEQNILSQRKVQ